MNQRIITKKQVVTLIGDPQAVPLTKPEVDAVVDALVAQGGIIETVEWLAENEACDIFFVRISVEEAHETLAELLANVPFDYAVQLTENRKKRLIISDMDSTMIQQECIDELADFAGLKAHISAITERAMNGELDFKSALRERVSLLKDLPEAVLQEAYNTRITPMPGAEALIATMRKNTAKAVLVSGGFTFFTSRIRDRFGFHIDEANQLEVAEGKLTGKVKEPILDKIAKRDALSFHAESNGLELAQTLAIGDGANDLDMIELAARNGGLGVAFHAKPSVQKAAFAAGGAVINHTNLRAVLFIQGYHHREITGTL